MARKSKKRSTGLSVNFKGVEGKSVTLPEGDYKVKVTEVTQEEGQAGDYLKWQFAVVGGKHDGRNVYYNTSLTPQALWNLRGLLEALGVDVPDDDLEMDFADLIDMECTVSIAHESYEGKKQARVVDYASAEDADDEDDDKPAKKGKKRASDDEDEDDDAPKAKKGRRARASDEDEDDEDEKPARKSKRGKASDDDDDDGEVPFKKKSRRSRDEDEDEDDEPKVKKGKKKKGGVDFTAEDVEDFSEDELEEIVETHDLDVNLAKLKTLSKKRAATVEALESAGLF